MRNKPRIRFKGFTEDWEQRKLNDLVTIRRGLTYKPSDIAENGIRVLRSSNIDEDQFITSNDDVFVNIEAVNIPFAKNGDILITSANGSNRLVGKHTIISDIADNSAVHGGFMLLAESNNPLFTDALLSSNWYKQFINTYVAGGNGAIGNLSKSDLESQTVMIPSEHEQVKIGQWYDNINQLITLHQCKLEKLKLTKNALLQKLFPQNGSKFPELRFKGVTDDWEQRKFKDIVFKRGKISEADLPYVEFEDINSGIGTLNKNILQKVGHKKGILFEAGDVLFGKLRPYLQNWLLCQFMGIAVGDFWVFQPQIVSSAFLYYLIQSEAYQSVANISSGTKMPRSSWSLVSETRFSIPKYKEATMIGEFFTSIDKNITLHQRKLDKLQEVKKGLLQKMFV